MTFFREQLKHQWKFLLVMTLCVLLSAMATGNPVVAMWVGFAFAAYSAIANDSIQTIGTYIASNKERPWWQLWLFIGGVFVATMGWSWYHYGGPVDIHLKSLPPSDHPVSVLITLEDPGSGSPRYREMKLGNIEGELQDREALGIPVRSGIHPIAVAVGSRIPPSPESQLGFGRSEPDRCLSGTSDENPCWHWSESESADFIRWEWDEPLPPGALGPPPFDTQLGSSGSPIAGEGGRLRFPIVGKSGANLGEISILAGQGGDVSSLRLFAKGFDTQVNEFHILQLLAPLFLVILTRLRMPVSTTFLLLNVFAASGKSMLRVTLKSLVGYGIAFVLALLIWGLLGRAMKRWFKGEAHPLWRAAQWLTTGFLWSVWLMQDAANIGVYLPRSLTFGEFLVFCCVILGGLAWLFRMGGEKIQEVVNEKSNVVDVRAATILDLVYGLILYVFKFASKIPMSTTWVFVGLLAGREIAMAWKGAGEDGRTIRDALRLAGRDLFYVTVGFVVSIILSSVINPTIGKGFFGWLF